MALPTVLRWGNPPPAVHNAPIYLGLQRRIFGISGIPVEAVDNLTGVDYTEALVAGQFDMGYMGTPPLFAALVRTDEYSIVGQGAMQYPAVYLIAAPEISSARDLVGKSVALNKLGTAAHSILRTLLRRQGMAESDVRLMILQEEWRIIEAIKMGEVAAGVIWEPYVSYVERVLGWRVVIDGRTIVVPSNHGYCLYARRTLIATEPGFVRRVIANYSECVRYAVEHVEESARSVYGQIPNISLEDIGRAIRREARHWTWNTTIDLEFLARVVRELKHQSVVPQEFVLDDVVASLPAV